MMALIFSSVVASVILVWSSHFFSWPVNEEAARKMVTHHLSPYKSRSQLKDEYEGWWAAHVCDELGTMQ